ncbi:MAG TPA: hypothetical protein DCM87_07605 [Planctomycetes bacterium]|nr:hypothetical protein [Planctomycetota bacterium]
MLAVEIAARLLFCGFLAVCLAPRRPQDLVLAFGACAAAVAAELHGAGREAAVCAILALAGGMGIAERFATPRSADAVRPFAAATAGLLAGQGMLLLGAAFALLVLLARAACRFRAPAHGDAPAGCTRTLSIRAESVHGMIDRIETVLERFGLTPSRLSVGRDRSAGELTINVELVLPEHGAPPALMAALQETEGVIRFALQ